MSTPTIGSVQKSKMSIEMAVCYSLPIPPAPANNEMKAATQIADGNFAVSAQPKFPRNLLIVVANAGPAITGGIVTIPGIDQDGNPVTEVFDFSAGAGTYTGNIAFAKVGVPVVSGLVGGGTAADTMSIGSGTKWGLPCGLNGRLVRVIKSVHAGA